MKFIGVECILLSLESKLFDDELSQIWDWDFQFICKVSKLSH
jgi:hypothetical protein